MPVGALSARIRPPWASTSDFAIASPRPAPGESGAFENRSNTCGSRSVAIPEPLSVTESSTPSAVAAGRDRHHATRGRVSERVRQQIAEDLPDPQAVDLDLRDRFGDARLEPDPGLARLSGERSDGGVDQIVRLGGLAMQRERARLGGRERLQVVQQPRHHLGLFQDRSQVRLVDGMDAVDQRLEVRLDHGERCPELVRDVGEQLPAPGLVRAEPLRHRVERAPEPLHLSRASLLDTGLVVPGGDAVGGLHHVDDRRREPASGANDEEHHDHDDHDPDREERAAVPVVSEEEPTDQCGQAGDRDHDEHEEHEELPEEVPAHAAPRLWALGRPLLVVGPPRRLPATPRRPAPWRSVWMLIAGPQSSANRYPTPWTVRTYRGVPGSGSSFLRMFFTCASIARS